MPALNLGSASFITTQDVAPVTASLTLPSGTQVVVLVLSGDNNYSNLSSPTLGGAAPTLNTLNNLTGSVVLHQRMLVWDFASPVSGSTTFQCTPPGFDLYRGTWISGSIVNLLN